MRRIRCGTFRSNEAPGAIVTPYQKIVRAARRGTGCRLTAEDCFTMGVMDDAIFTRADLDDRVDSGELDAERFGLNGGAGK